MLGLGIVTNTLARLLIVLLVTLFTSTSLAFQPCKLASSNPWQKMTAHADELEAQVSTKNNKDLQGIKGIIFDIDGTLADSWKLGFDATLVVLENNGIPKISLETYHNCTRYATPERMARHAGFQPGDADFENTGRKLADEFDEFYVNLVDKKTAGFYEGIFKLLQEIPSSVAIGTLTNACVAYAHAVLKANLPTSSQDNGKLSYERFQRSIHGADTVPAPKPHPDGLLRVCNDLGLDPKECIYVGDSPSDAVAAKAAEMPSIGVLWGSHSKKSLTEAPFSRLCETVHELRSVLSEVVQEN